MEQIFALNRGDEASGQTINHVVFMGMGEPLANYADVMRRCGCCTIRGV